MPSSSYRLLIPHPCTQSWDKMTPSGNGRFCDACSKVVTDFTGMTDQQVQDFFILHHGEPVCGRFRQVQLDRIRIQVPSYILQKQLPHWKKFLVILIICFGSSIFSFDVAFGSHFTNTTGSAFRQEVVQKNKKTAKKKKRKKRRTPEMIIDLGDMVLGYTQTPAEPVNLPSPVFPYPELNKGDMVSLSPKRQEEKKPNNKRSPFSKTEFILPAGWRSRKRKANGR